MTISYLENGDLALFNGLKFRRDKQSGYYFNSTIHKRLHVYVWEFFNGKIPDGYQIHHKDFDKSNNEIENLILLSASDHAKLHGESWDDERYEKQIKNLNENARPKASEWHGSDAGHEWHKKHYEQMKSRLHQKKIFVCDECGRSFEGVDNGFTRFCSNKCKAAHRRKSGIDNEIRQCEYCGKEFEVNKYAKTRTCSRSCRNKIRWNKINQEG